MRSQKQFALLSLKILIALAIFLGIARFLQRASAEFSSREELTKALTSIQPLWITASFIFCLSGLLWWGLFWKWTLQNFGYSVRADQVWEYYLLGHLGKYVPGKAIVLVLRAAKLRHHGVPISIATLTVFLETLVMMAVGATLGALALAVLQVSPRWTWLALALAIVTSIPTIPPWMNWILARIASQKRFAIDQKVSSAFDWPLLGKGWVVESAGWVMMSLSLWCLLRGLAVDFEGSWFEFRLLLACTVAATLSVVAGFLSFLPGGAGVREYVIMISLAPIIGHSYAVGAAIGMRLLSLLCEVLGYGVFAAWNRSIPQSESIQSCQERNEHQALNERRIEP